MALEIGRRKSKNGSKIHYFFQWGKAKGERLASGIFTYARPKDDIERNHNSEALIILKLKHSQLILDSGATGTRFIPKHRLKSNFLDYYSGYVNKNRKYGNRHLENSLVQFKAFWKKQYISPGEITESLCEEFRNYLVKHFNGETPADYFYKFKTVLEAAKREGYFPANPSQYIKSKSNPNKQKKEVLEIEDYKKLVDTPCLNYEVKKAFVFCLYTGLRWCDVKSLRWEHIRTNSIKLSQKKTDVDVEIPLHDIAKKIIGERNSGKIFHLPSSRGAGMSLAEWCRDAGIEKHITWHCARMSFSVLLQDEGVNSATVAGMLGHTSTKYVEQVYQRYRVSVGRKAIIKLPEVGTESF